MKSWNREIGDLSYHIALKFDRHIGSSAAEVPVKCQSCQTFLNKCHSFETSRDLAIRRIIRYWNRVPVSSTVSTLIFILYQSFFWQWIFDIHTQWITEITSYIEVKEVRGNEQRDGSRMVVEIARASTDFVICRTTISERFTSLHTVFLSRLHISSVGSKDYVIRDSTPHNMTWREGRSCGFV